MIFFSGINFVSVKNKKFFMFDHHFLVCKYCLEYVEKKFTLVCWGFREGRSGFSKHTYFFGLSLQSKQYLFILSSINFLWNLSKSFVSADFVVIRILPLLPVGENDLFAPENFKVLFRHDQLIMAY